VRGAQAAHRAAWSTAISQPQNVFLLEVGVGVKLLDFGLARVAALATPDGQST